MAPTVPYRSLRAALFIMDSSSIRPQLGKSPHLHSAADTWALGHTLLEPCLSSPLPSPCDQIACGLYLHLWEPLGLFLHRLLYVYGSPSRLEALVQHLVRNRALTHIVSCNCCDSDRGAAVVNTRWRQSHNSTRRRQTRCPCLGPFLLPSLQLRMF